MEKRYKQKGSLCRLLAGLLGFARLAGFALLLAGCTGQEAARPLPDRTIRLLADTELRSRSAAVDRFAGETLAFAAGTTTGAYSEVWEATATGGQVFLSEAQYYPEDNSRIYLRGYHPAVPVGSGGVSFRLDGNQDVLLSGEQSGSLQDMFSQEAKRFRFVHLLAQLNIRLRVTGDYPADTWLRRLRIDGSHRNALLDLRKGSLLFSGPAEPLTAWDATVWNDDTPDANGALLGTAYPDTLLPPVMVEPGVALTLAVTIRTADGPERTYSAIPVRFQEADGLPQAGTSYLLSVTLGDATEETALTTIVAEWQRGNEGLGIIH